MINSINSKFFNSISGKNLLGVLFITILAKGFHFFNGIGNSVDDYRFALDFPGFIRDAFVKGSVLSQGRWGRAVLDYFLNHFHADHYAGIYLGGLLFAIQLAILSLFLLKYWGFRLSNLQTVLIGGLMVNFPFFVDIYCFRGLTFALAISSILLCIPIALSLLRKGGLVNQLIATLIFVYCISIYQVSLTIIAVILLIDFLLNALQDDTIKQVFTFKRLRPILLLVVATACYYIVFKLINYTLEIKANDRTSFIDPEKILTRITSVGKHLFLTFFDDQNFFSKESKFLLVGIYIASFITLLKSNIAPIIKVLGITIIALLPIVAIGPSICLNKWWAVPRTLVANTFLIGASSAYLVQNITGSKITLSLSTALLLMINISFVLSNNRVFTNQYLNTVRDLNLANRIVSRIEVLPEFKYRKVMVLGRPTPDLPISSNAQNINQSGFAPTQIRPKVLSYVSGYELSHIPYNLYKKYELKYRSKPAFPHVDCIAIEGQWIIVKI